MPLMPFCAGGACWGVDCEACADAEGDWGGAGSTAVAMRTAAPGGLPDALLCCCAACDLQSPGMVIRPIRMQEKIPRTDNRNGIPPRFAVYRNQRFLRRAWMQSSIANSAQLAVHRMVRNSRRWRTR